MKTKSKNSNLCLKCHKREKTSPRALYCVICKLRKMSENGIKSYRKHAK